MTPREVKMDGAKASYLYPGGTFLKKGHKFSSADEYLSFMEEDQPDQEENSAASSIRRSGRKPESVLVKKLLSTTDVSCLGNAGNVPAAPIFSGLLQALDMYSAQEQTDYTCETDADDRVELSCYQASLRDCTPHNVLGANHVQAEPARLIQEIGPEGPNFA